MTFALFTRPTLSIPRSADGAASITIDETDRPRPELVTVVVPVRDNQPGIDRIVRWWAGLPVTERPHELVIVDDGSTLPVISQGDGIAVVRGHGRGPASARNLGWRRASTPWVAFLDSDCVPDPGWPGAFADGWAGEVAVQGSVRALEPGLLAGYYERQGILEPMAWSDDGRPYYLITANALVHRDALERIGGFREQFSLAAGEDVDLGLRLAATGKLYSCRSASVAHDFEPDFGSFVRRFLRYGRGNRLLSEFHRSSFFAPRPFWPRSGRPDDLVLAVVAYAALTAGWVRQGPGSS